MRPADHGRPPSGALALPAVNAYVAPEQPQWQPHSEQDITDAIDGGLIAVTHYFDAKREVGSSSGDRKELGRDLASFAIDGGALLIGLAELNLGSFVRHLPHQLVRAFRSTLEELTDSDVVLRVIDASHPTRLCWRGCRCASHTASSSAPAPARASPRCWLR